MEVTRATQLRRRVSNLEQAVLWLVGAALVAGTVALTRVWGWLAAWFAAYVVAAALCLWFYRSLLPHQLRLSSARRENISAWLYLLSPFGGPALAFVGHPRMAVAITSVGLAAVGTGLVLIGLGPDGEPWMPMVLGTYFLVALTYEIFLLALALGAESVPKAEKRGQAAGPTFTAAPPLNRGPGR